MASRPHGRVSVPILMQYVGVASVIVPVLLVAGLLALSSRRRAREPFVPDPPLVLDPKEPVP
ncbi:hypothetical protein [Phenylobacterium sp.]|uniref:hypothetical protein n=1 Tax=Phenylobacterium sp. TaxID=1871053 RepID=UPI002DF3ED3A|nr:hypothetical protein [Phenylobacterium sp.]